jgi:glycosyltransferase involved in cell wall biosynthesis
MNVLFARPRLDSGGAARHMLALATALKERGHTMSLATSGADHLASFSAFPVHRVRLYPSTPLHLFLSAARLARLVREAGVQIIHSHHRFAALAGRMASRLTGAPLVGTVHEYRLNWRWLSGLWLAPHVCVPSRALRDHLVRFNHLPPERVTVVPLGAAPIAPEASAESRVRRFWGDDFSGPIVGYVGRLAPEKGVDTLIRSLPAVFDACPDARAVIVGDGPERRALEGLAESLGFGERVRFTGEQPDAASLMTAMRVIAAPSRTENFSLTIAEAMAAARPVVVSAVGGLPEMVEDGVTGRLCPPDDPAAFAQGLIDVLADLPRADEMGRTGQRRAAAWSPAHAAEITEQVYQRALAGPRRHA